MLSSPQKEVINIKTKIPGLSYNAMFKAVFSNNKLILSKLVESILEYCQINIDVQGKELIIKNNELPLGNYKDKQLICDYIIKLNDTTELNIEINRENYLGLTERNMTYSFKIYYEHFKTGDKYQEFNKYNLLQVNFNNFSNPNNKTINRFFLIDVNDITNSLSRNLCIINIDIASCFNLVYNNTKKEEISNLERWSAIVYAEYLEDISSILESDMLNMKEKERFLNDIKEKSQDKDTLEAIKFEDNLDYRFKLAEEGAYIKGIEQNTIDIIKNMLKNNIDYETISKVTNKSIEEIKEIEQSLNKE